MAMMRGMWVFGVLGVTGSFLFLGAGLLSEPRPDISGAQASSRPARATRVAPTAVAVPKTGSQVSRPDLSSGAGDDRQHPGEIVPATVREGTGGPPRLPAQIANLVKRINLERVIEKYARHYGVDQDLVWAVIRQESGFDPQALSPKGARGLMQLMPGTAALMGVSDAFDVEQNIAGGVKYLERCLSQFDQDVGLALAAYNAGPANVVKYQGCPPFSETQQYVARVLKVYQGESLREDLQRFGLVAVMEHEASAPEGPTGLAWQVPRPQWRIAAPQCKPGAPHWKVSRLPF
jgi:soluble lytic murein transglycosylase-like protein